jgi:hypothetical protein
MAHDECPADEPANQLAKANEDDTLAPIPSPHTKLHAQWGKYRA